MSRLNYERAHKILVLIAYAQKPPINTKSGESRGAIMVSKWPASSYTSVYFLFASCEGSGESVHLHWLALANVARK